MHSIIGFTATIIGMIPAENSSWLSCILLPTTVQATADLEQIFIVFETCLFYNWSAKILHFKIRESVPLAHNFIWRGGLSERSVIIS